MKQMQKTIYMRHEYKLLDGQCIKMGDIHAKTKITSLEHKWMIRQRQNA